MIWRPSKEQSGLVPGATVGIVGGGQLARMMANAAAHMGLRVIIYTPDAAAPAIQLANDIVLGSYEDYEKLRRFAAMTDVITCEFENVPAETLRFLTKQKKGLVQPDPAVFEVAQNRIREKEYMTALNIPTTPYHPVYNEADFRAGVAALGSPCLLKTATMGYDGKGQYIVRSESRLDGLIADLFYFGDAEAGALKEARKGEWILEKFVDFVTEISVIAARNRKGEVVIYPVIENMHRSGVLHRSVVPATISPFIQKAAIKITKTLIESLRLEGLLTVEFFVTHGGGLLVNELAPRPHNSGHWSIDAAVTSQFEQCIRAVMGWPLGNAELLCHAEMTNLLGTETENWRRILEDPNTKLHLYGKEKSAAGRKMGHVTKLIK